MVPVALTVLFSAVAQAQPQVSVYNWTDYIGETTLADFEKATGIKVSYETVPYENSREREVLSFTSGEQLDVVLTDRAVRAGGSLKVFSHLLGESTLSFFASKQLMRKLKDG